MDYTRLVALGSPRTNADFALRIDDNFNTSTDDYLAEIMPTAVSFSNGIVYGRMFTLAAPGTSVGERTIISGHLTDGTEVFRVYSNFDGTFFTLNATYGGKIFTSAQAAQPTVVAWLHLQYYFDFVTPANSVIWANEDEVSIDTIPTASTPTESIASFRWMFGWLSEALISEFMCNFGSNLSLARFNAGRVALAESRARNSAPRPFELGLIGELPYFKKPQAYYNMRDFSSDAGDGVPLNLASGLYPSNATAKGLTQLKDAKVGASANKACRFACTSGTDDNYLILSDFLPQQQPCTKIFFSYWINTHGHNFQSPVLEMYSNTGGQGRAIIQLHVSGLTNNNYRLGVISKPGAIPTDTTNYIFVRSTSEIISPTDADWHWVCGYFAETGSHFSVDNVEHTVVTPDAGSITSFTTLEENAMHVAVATNPMPLDYSLAHIFCCLDGKIDQLNSAAGVDVTDSAIRSRFVNPTTKRPIFQGINGGSQFPEVPDFSPDVHMSFQTSRLLLDTDQRVLLNKREFSLGPLSVKHADFGPYNADLIHI